MIVRTLADGRLFCINQTSHALMAAAFCRAWGNRTFRPREPRSIVRMAVAQHDNGWYEWEAAPKLRADGFPMDFVHDDDPVGKVKLWQRGVARAAAQHPYAGVLISGHAARLYGVYPGRGLSQAAQDAIETFVEAHARQVELLRRQWSHDAAATGWLSVPWLEANITLLQFCDVASLQVLMPWEKRRVFPACPVDDAGTTTDIVMEWDDEHITFTPWPYAVDAFQVDIHGRVLEQAHFDSEPQYQAALADAPYLTMSWRVTAGA